jgi:protoheme IX farnesyltransferase
MRDYLELTKPRITWLILMSAGVGYFFGLSPVGGPVHMLRNVDPWSLLNTLLGIALVASGTATLNQWWEREADGRMRRTARRPLPSGRVSPAAALAFGIAISLAGFVELCVMVNVLAAELALFTLVSYLVVYTPLKRRHWLCTAVGAVPGAMPPVIGYAAAQGSVELTALLLFAILFFWQFPHFYAIAWMYREDYARAGIRMLPVVERTFRRTTIQMLLFAILLIPVSVAPSIFAITGRAYAGVALILGAWFLHANLGVAHQRTSTRARGVFIASIGYLPLLYGVMVLDRIWL